MSKVNHTHKFKRHTYKTGNSVYFCALPDCLFKISTELALGKKCVCWRCGNDFILSTYSLRLAQPHCTNCHKMKPGHIAKEKLMPETATHTVSDLASRLQSLTRESGSEGDDDV